MELLSVRGFLCVVVVSLVQVILIAIFFPDYITARQIDNPRRLYCNMLPIDECSFAVDSDGRRCLLETTRGMDWHICQTSNIVVGNGNPIEYIETDECVNACGVTKMTVGLSTDMLNSLDFTSKLCSRDCIQKCANIMDLYTNLAAGEGSILEDLCTEHESLRRSALENSGNSSAAVEEAEGPSPAPSSGI